MELQKMREMRQRRIAKKQAKLQRRMKRCSSRASKSSKYGGSACSSVVSNNVKEVKDCKSQVPERDILLDRRMEDTLDRDIERSKSSDRQSKNHEYSDRERERTRRRILSEIDPKSASSTPDCSLNTVLPSPRRRELNTFRDLFNIELDRFTVISLGVRIKHNVDLNTLLL